MRGVQHSANISPIGANDAVYIQNVIYMRGVQHSANISPIGANDAVSHTERHIHERGTTQREH